MTAQHTDLSTEVDDPVAAVREEELPASVVPLLEAYETTIGGRDPYLWKWLAHLFPTFTLSAVPDRHRPRAQKAKFLASLFVTVTDDLAEKHGDRATFAEARKIPFEHQHVDLERAGVDTDALAYLETVWTEFEATVADSPRTSEFGDVLRFDLQQIFQAIAYTSLATDRLEMVSEAALWRHDVHNMMILCYADIDLLYAESFDSAELSSLRQLVSRTQRLARICNWLVTWERELAEGDPISGVVVRALEEDVVSRDQIRDLQASPTAETVDPVVDAIRDSDVEDTFLDQWDAEYDRAQELATDVDSVDAGAYCRAFETILDYHLESRGLL